MAAGTPITPTVPTLPALDSVPRGADLREVAKIVMLAGAADFTASYAAAGTSNYAVVGRYAAVAFAVKLLSGTAPTSIELTIYFTDSLADAPVDYVTVNDSTVAGVTTCTVGELAITYTSAAAFVTRPIECAGRYMKVKCKRTGGGADTRIEVAVWPISHIA